MHIPFAASSRVSRGLLIFTLLGAMGWQESRAGEEASTIENRLMQSAKYLASDELEGRGVGTKGLDLAADYVAAQFREIGLKTELYNGTPFQKFTTTIGAKLGEPNQLVLVDPSKDGKDSKRVELKLGDQFNPLAMGGSGKFDLPLVFVGYGITAKDEHYDDYAGVDVKDKAVIILRHEPQQANPHSVFDGTKNSRYAPFKRKISNAYEHGAAAVIFVNDEYDIQKNVEESRKSFRASVDEIAEAESKFKARLEGDPKPTTSELKEHNERIVSLAERVSKLATQARQAHDPILRFDQAGTDGSDGRDFPVLFCQRGALDPIFEQALGTTLGQLEKQIDVGPTPHSQPLDGWRAIGQTSVERQQAEVKNVVGVLEGEGPLADETIVLGAHYDHLGWGGEGSAAPGVHEIHNGADDNGSGTTALIEVARQLAGRGQKLPRRLVFIAFTGEERGLLGSAHWVRDPLFPIDKIVAMLNMDMVGRLQDEKLIVHGTGTATEFDALADRIGKEYGFQITKKPSGFGPSDHSSFYAAKVPVLFFFTGSHKDYHRPTDDVDKLNVPGMRRITAMVADTAVLLAQAPERPHLQEVKGSDSSLGSGGDRPYFGSIPDFAQDQPGYALTGVTKGGPAERGGLKAGDIIIRFGDSKIGNLEDFDSALRKFKAGDKVPVVVKRGSDEVKLEVTLDPPR
jgi:hypothetical protein